MIKINKWGIYNLHYLITQMQSQPTGRQDALLYCWSRNLGLKFSLIRITNSPESTSPSQTTGGVLSIPLLLQMIRCVLPSDYRFMGKKNVWPAPVLLVNCQLLLSNHWAHSQCIVSMLKSLAVTFLVVLLGVGCTGDILKWHIQWGVLTGQKK